MPKFSFSLAFTGVDLFDDDIEEALMVSMPYGLWALVDGEVRVNVAVEAASPAAAARAVVTAVREIVPTASATHIIEDLVSVSDIADRVPFKRQYVLMLAKGERGPGDFPPPRGYISRRQRVWDWAAVKGWFEKHYEFDFDGFTVLGRDQVTEAWAAIDRLQSSTFVRSEQRPVELTPRRQRPREGWQQAVATEERASYDVRRGLIPGPAGSGASLVEAA